MSKLDQIVFIIEDGKIIETSIRDSGLTYIEETTTPYGVSAKYHTRGAELWTWGVNGSFPEKLSTFASEEDATEALEDTFAHDFWNCPSILAFKDRASAEECLVDMDA